MSAYFGTDDVVQLIGSVDISGANSGVLEVGKPMDVKRIVAVVTTATTGASGSVITVSKRNASGSGGATTLGTFTIATGVAANTVLYADIADVKTAVTGSDASQPAAVTTGRVLGIQTNDPGVFEINPGQELVVASDGGGDAGVVSFYASGVEMGNNPDRFTATKLTFTLA